EPAAAGPRPLPGCLVLLPGGRAAARIQAEIALAGPTAPLRAAVAAWLARAHGLVLSLDARTLRRWGWRARWAWDSLHAAGLVEPSEAEELRRDPPPVPLDRLALW